MRFLDLLHARKLPVVVSLPENDPALARAARRGGAAGLKVHLHVHHHASGTVFRGLAEERDRIAAVVEAAAGLAVGIMPGTAARAASVQDLRELAGLGVDFLDMYGHDYPEAYAEVPLAKVLALGPANRPEDAGSLVCDAIEASVVPSREYGRPLTDEDLATCAAIARASRVPVIVPSQKLLRPEDARPLVERGAAGFFLGAVVTGRTAASIERAVAAFVAKL